MGRGNRRNQPADGTTLVAGRISLSEDEQQKQLAKYGQWAPFWFSCEARRANDVKCSCEKETQWLFRFPAWLDNIEAFLDLCDGDETDPRVAVCRSIRDSLLSELEHLYDAL